MAKEYTPTVPRLKAIPTQADPKILVGIGEKGGISVYGLQRFPVSLFYEQWVRLLGENPTEGTVAAEIIQMGLEHPELLAEKESKPTAKDVEDRTFTINANEVALAQAESTRLTGLGDMTGAVKFATIKAVAEANKGKVSFDQLNEIMKLKARK
jgi:hypothetical protein